jgi:hypothetical protein
MSQFPLKSPSDAKDKGNSNYKDNDLL